MSKLQFYFGLYALKVNHLDNQPVDLYLTLQSMRCAYFMWNAHMHVAARAVYNITFIFLWYREIALEKLSKLLKMIDLEVFCFDIV